MQTTGYYIFADIYEIGLLRFISVRCYASERRCEHQLLKYHPLEPTY